MHWAFKRAGARDVRESPNYEHGGVDLYVAIEDQWLCVFYTASSREFVYEQTLKRIKELKTINDVKKRLKG